MEVSIRRQYGKIAAGDSGVRGWTKKILVTEILPLKYYGYK